MKITLDNIFNEAIKGNRKVLKSPLVDKVKDNYGNTPLHWLTENGVKEVLEHPSVDQVKDKWGNTPLHLLARWGHLNKEDLKKYYPWFKIPNGEVTEKTVTQLLNTPKSVRFILEDL